ncbi:MCE family protein [Mycolicibacterium thermoresistibile]|uniref:Virulence factor Mce family protein n=2 Tax=Mycolicibacterium thermoresistibile TaxID=1797 RepID=G7CFX0_MYCT3|nr:MCE family protein [Mycolicibacterium thermoresistibile]EHI13399.1 virulence factor Mce family protein [Mycolicibacterium thermoresistibile ATCC 19527]MCV7189191.1 MCE family protein [Mycolicibacterium thermoresistibile]GAT14619.1 virulence factor Mce family protein [Mycolicibacterium thermoresistibile]SNW19846.1 virulence factor Mce family protein [Mycolicibacterium thermoresistibile]
MSAPITRRRARAAIAGLLAVLLAAGVIAVWPRPAQRTVTGLFASAVGLYVGDEVKVAGVPVGRVTAIEPGPAHTTVSMRVRADIPIPADASALIVAPNLVSARFVEFAPVYDGGPILADDAVIGPDRTAVPIEWDQVKDELTRLAAQLGPQPGAVQGPLSQVINQAADTFDGAGRSFRDAVRELSQAAGRLGDSRADLIGTVKNLSVVVDALAASNEQIVAFTSHVASVSQVFANSSQDIDQALGALNTALSDVRDLLRDNDDALRGQIDRLTEFTSLLTERSDDIEQVLHLAPHALANFYNIYTPAQASVAGIVTLPNFGNPVQLMCAGMFETAKTPESYNRAEICRQRMAPVIKRLQMNYPPFLMHPINSITAYKGQIIYDTPETQAKAQTPISHLQWQPLPGVTPPSVPPDTDLTELMVPEPQKESGR